MFRKFFYLIKTLIKTLKRPSWALLEVIFGFSAQVEGNFSFNDFNLWSYNPICGAVRVPRPADGFMENGFLLTPRPFLRPNCDKTRISWRNERKNKISQFQYLQEFARTQHIFFRGIRLTKLRSMLMCSWLLRLLQIFRRSVNLNTSFSASSFLLRFISSSFFFSSLIILSFVLSFASRRTVIWILVAGFNIFFDTRRLSSYFSDWIFLPSSNKLGSV